MSDASKRIVIGITGASGVIYGIDLLIVLKNLGYETHVVLTEWARKNITMETSYSLADVAKLAAHLYSEDDFLAPISSGSFLNVGMAVVPCTIKTLSGITNSYDSNLLVRAADVAIKEGRPLVLVVRETPLHKGHLRLMLSAASLGVIILPPIPAFYHNPKSISDIVRHTTGKILDCFKIPHDLFQRWGG